MENNFDHRTNSEILAEYAALFWRWAWLLVLCALLAGGLVYWNSNKQTRTYSASTTVAINAAGGSQTADYYQITTNQQLAATYARTMTMSPVLNSVAKSMGLTAFPYTASVQVQPIQDTQLMTISVTDTDPERAALIANTLVSVFAEKIQADQTSRYADSKKNLFDQMTAIQDQIKHTNDAITLLNQKILETNNEIEVVNTQIQKDTNAQVPPATGIVEAERSKLNQLGTSVVQYQSQLAPLQATQQQYQYTYNNLFQSYQSVLFTEAQARSIFVQEDPAYPNRSPIAPKPMRNALLAAMTGLVLAAGGVILMDFLDSTVRDPQEITRKWGVPILGTILNYEHDENTLITALQPRSPITEAFRSLRTNLNFASFNDLAHTILITSPSPEDGKTTVAANLGNVIAQSGRKVVVVDADMRRPRVHKVFQLTNRYGLADQFIHSEEHFNGSLKQTEIPGLQILTSGNMPPNPAELLGSEKMIRILNQLGNMFDITIVDAPPLLMVTDALVLAPRVDGVILVVKPAVTKRAALNNAMEQMMQVKANIIGVVLNDVKIGSRSGYYHYSGYYYSKKYSKGYHYTETDEIPQRKHEPATSEPDNPSPLMPTVIDAGLQINEKSNKPFQFLKRK